MIQKVNVTGSASFEYVKSQLKLGKSLSECIEKMSIDQGEIFSFVPVGISEKNLYSFNIGGIYPSDHDLFINKQPIVPVRNDARKSIGDEIEKCLGESVSNCCIFEDPLSTPKDKWVTSSGIKYVQLNNDMFYFFDSKNIVKKDIDEAWDASEAHVFLCALGKLNFSEHDRFASFKVISIKDLELFVESIMSFVVKAYDGEGYLMWQKEKIFDKF
jgi:hypothetical protein